VRLKDELLNIFGPGWGDECTLWLSFSQQKQEGLTRSYQNPSFCSFWANFNEKFPKWRNSGTDVMIFKIFSPNFSAKKLAFLTQNKAI
jgi:hypothetical protein